MSQIIVRVTSEMRDELRLRSEAEERTVSQTVRLAIKRYLASEGVSIRVEQHPTCQSSDEIIAAIEAAQRARSERAAARQS